jgi:cyclopropane-fatty-acyl-phospholipid synthase
MLKKINFFQKITRKILINLLLEMKVGHLSLEEKKDKISIGNKNDIDTFSSDIQVLDPKVYPRIIKRGTIGASEAFILNEWETNNLTTLLRILLRNKAQFFKLDGGFAKVWQFFWRYLDKFTRNKPTQSRLNIIAHYDLGNEFFKLFLDPSLMYSSAIFLQPTDNLETASEQKLKRICEKLSLKPEHHIIEIGTGWGGFAIYAASKYGCHVTTTTISEKQYEFTQKRIQDLGLSEKITLLKEDYRNLKGRYDRLVSIEMIEAVGYEFMDDFVIQCNQLLNSNGMAMIQAILRPDQKYHQVYKEVDFIKKYIFPGGCLVSTLFLLEKFAKHSDLRLFDLKDMGYDYAKTLSAWRESFMVRLPEVRALGFNSEFIRMWEFYLAYCEAGFLERYITVAQLIFVKPDYALI